MTATLSPSALRHLVADYGCPLCYYRDRRFGIRRPSIIASILGAVDRTVKSHFDESAHQDTPTPILQQTAKDVVLADRELVQKCRHYQTAPKYEHPDTDAIVRGGMDDLAVEQTESDKALVVLDVKTKATPPATAEDVSIGHRLQVSLYTLMLEAAGHQAADYALLVFVSPTMVDADGCLECEATPVRVEVDRDWARNVVGRGATILEGSPPDPNPDCDFCQFVNDADSAEVTA